MVADIVKVFFPAIISFVIGILITPVISDYLYKNQMWKKKSVSIATDGRTAEISQKLHNDETKKTPRMGGIIVWFSSFLTAVLIWTISYFLPSDLSMKLDFVSRNQTWLPLFALVAGSIFGLVDDYLVVQGKGGHIAGGLSLNKRILIVAAIGLLCGAWFFAKLDVDGIGLPGGLELVLGPLIIPFFAIVMLGVYSGGVIDGLDGLSGGIFATIFSAYAGIAFYQQQINLASFCLVVVGGILAFLWFNIPPARFYMSETGMMGLTVALTVVAFMTDRLGGGYGVIVLPVIAFPLVITTLSDIIQLLSKKYRGKKIFIVAPLHHHFEAIGWPSYKVTMRYWIFGVVFAILGVILALVG